jgi:translation initiation factor 2 alpha subunit (eIF-2alpha)
MVTVTEEWKDSVSENIIKQTEHKKEISASKLLPEIRNKVNKELLAYVEVMAIADVTQYGALYEELTTVVDDINRVISNRKSGNAEDIR